jgi:hypothetical protein
MVKNRGRHRNSWHAPWGLRLCFFWEVGMLDFKIFYYSQWVPIKFPTCFPSSQCVLNSTSLYPISFALSHTLVIFRTSPEGGDDNIFILGQSKVFFYIFGDWPIKDAHHKRTIIEHWGSSQRINMSHTILYLENVKHSHWSLWGC